MGFLSFVVRPSVNCEPLSVSSLMILIGGASYSRRMNLPKLKYLLPARCSRRRRVGGYPGQNRPLRWISQLRDRAPGAWQST